MNINRKILTLATIVILVSLVSVFSFAKAATNLAPDSGAFSNSAPTSTFHTLEDIYLKIIHNLTQLTNSIFPSSSPDGTMHTLDDIYNAITPPLTWQVNPDDPGSYLSLCWSAGYHERGNNCSAGNGLLDPTAGAGYLIGAKEYCEYLDPDGKTLNCTSSICTPVNYWRLPFVLELGQALSTTFLPTDNAGGYPGGFDIYGYTYWSGSQYGSDSAWTDSFNGTGITTTHYDRSMFLNARCVHGGSDLELFCGDGFVQSGEHCDDGNITDGDGCSSACQIEPGYDCTASVGAKSRCGLVGGEPCSDNNYCFSQNCIGNVVCSGIGNPGDSCTSQYDCLTNTCIANKCNNDYNVGQYCGNDYDCASNICLSNACNVGNANGESCDSLKANYECLSNYCDIDGYICKPSLNNGNSCQNNSECLSGGCVDGTCVATVDNGDGCSIDAQCKNGTCDTSDSQTCRGDLSYGSPCAKDGDCSSGFVCNIYNDGTCGYDNPDGYDNCSQPYDCASGDCQSNTCGSFSAVSGASCGGWWDCQNLYCQTSRCNDNVASDGVTACTQDYNCASDHCDREGTNSGYCGAGWTDGTVCDGSSSYNCSSGFCNCTDNSCANYACGHTYSVGHECSGGYDCASKLCKEGTVCVNDIGGACTDDTDCSGSCISGTCNGGIGNEGLCTSGNDYECRSNYCDNDNICKAYLPNGGSCQNNSMCLSDGCIDGICSATIATGDACLDGSNDACISGFCSSVNYCSDKSHSSACGYEGDCTSAVCNGGFCGNWYFDGYICLNDYDCISGWCNRNFFGTGDHFCGHNYSNGEGCAENWDCNSGFCDGGQCSP